MSLVDELKTKTVFELKAYAKKNNIDLYGTKTKAENPNTISVWCTDKNAWRSFRIDSVSKVVRLS